MAEITIAIPTFRRPQGLEKLLRALEQLKTSHAVSVLVADNDSERHDGYDVVSRLASSYHWPLQAIVVHERGIAQNRNALVEQSLKNPRMEFLAMLDDDEWPIESWLESMMDVQRATDADAVAGAVLREFERAPGRLAAHCDGLLPARGKTGVTHEIDSTANVVVSRTCLDEGYRFDPEFALTGGEDRDFFTRLARDGKRFAWCDEAIVYSLVPASRASLSWGLARAYRAGNSDMRVLLKYGLSAGAMTREIAKIGGAVVVAPFAFLIFFADASRSANAIRRVFRAAGKIAAFFGRHYNEYAVVHGK
jgi:glycosyltransferase involved in cell wall biosynthesis